MGKTKYPILDEDFLINSLASCRDDEERGLLLVGFIGGLHPSSITELNEKSIIKEGSKYHLEWKRPKTNKTLRVEIPKEILKPIQNFVTKYRRKSRQHYDKMIKNICGRAGYENVSMMTLRHTNCVYRHVNKGISLFSLHHGMGCTPEVVGRNYTKVEEEVRVGFKYKLTWRVD